MSILSDPRPLSTFAWKQDDTVTAEEILLATADIACHRQAEKSLTRARARWYADLLESTAAYFCHRLTSTYAEIISDEPACPSPQFQGDPDWADTDWGKSVIQQPDAMLNGAIKTLRRASILGGASEAVCKHAANVVHAAIHTITAKLKDWACRKA